LHIEDVSFVYLGLCIDATGGSESETDICRRIEMTGMYIDFQS